MSIWLSAPAPPIAESVAEPSAESAAESSALSALVCVHVGLLLLWLASLTLVILFG